MPVQVNVTVQNLDQIKRAMAQLPQQMVPELRDAVTKSALKVERESKILSPVDTGRLRASINTSYGFGPLGIGAKVATNVEYAIYVHEGTARMKARPFMKQAVDLSQQDINRYFEQAVERVIEKIN